jgi:hypothetical protein
MVFGVAGVEGNRRERRLPRERVGTVAWPYGEMAGIRLDAGGAGVYYE